MTTEQICRHNHNHLAEFLDSYILIGTTPEGDLVARFAVTDQKQADKLNRVLCLVCSGGGVSPEVKK